MSIHSHQATAPPRHSFSFEMHPSPYCRKIPVRDTWTVLENGIQPTSTLNATLISLGAKKVLIICFGIYIILAVITLHCQEKVRILLAEESSRHCPEFNISIFLWKVTKNRFVIN